MHTALGRLQKPLWMALLVCAALLFFLMRYQPATAHPVAQINQCSNSLPASSPRDGEFASYLPMIESCAVVPTATPTPDPWTAPPVSIEVFSPISTGVYHSPIEIIGYSQTFEGSVVVRLRDSKGEIIGERPTQGGSSDGFDFFHTRLRFFVNAQQNGTVEVFEISAKDGSEIHKVTIPVILQPGQRVLDIDYPTPGQSICTPIQVSGYSNTFEANVVANLYTRSGKPLTMTITMGGNLGIYERFSAVLSQTLTTTQPLLVDVYGGDGQGIGLVDQTRVPVSLYNCKIE